MPPRIDLTDKQYGRLTAISISGKDKGGNFLWKCKCSCGNFKIIRSGDLRSGHTKSCGCFQSEKTTMHNTTHNLSRSTTYKSWSAMKDRCNNPKIKNYENYGKRGITVCKRWLKFENFLEDLGLKPKGLTIERINNNGNYEPSNCKWATPKEQNRNSRNNRKIRYQNQTKCLIEWAEILEVNYKTLWTRLRNHPPQIAFNM